MNQYFSEHILSEEVLVMNGKEFLDQRAEFLNGSECTLKVSKMDWLNCLSWLIPMDCIISVSDHGPYTYRVSLMLGPSAKKQWGIKDGAE